MARHLPSGSSSPIVARCLPRMDLGAHASTPAWPRMACMASSPRSQGKTGERQSLTCTRGRNPCEVMHPMRGHVAAPKIVTLQRIGAEVGASGCPVGVARCRAVGRCRATVRQRAAGPGTATVATPPPLGGDSDSAARQPPPHSGCTSSRGRRQQHGGRGRKETVHAPLVARTAMDAVTKKGGKGAGK